jgi:hypothetical protein
MSWTIQPIVYTVSDPRKSGLEVNTEETKYMFLSHEYDAG